MWPSKLGLWCPRPHKHFKLATASRRAAFSGNTSLIATFSTFLIVLFSECGWCNGSVVRFVFDSWPFIQMYFSYQQYNLVLAKGRWCSATEKVIAGLAKCTNGSLLPTSPACKLPLDQLWHRHLYRMWKYLYLYCWMPIGVMLSTHICSVQSCFLSVSLCYEIALSATSSIYSRLFSVLSHLVHWMPAVSSRPYINIWIQRKTYWTGT